MRIVKATTEEKAAWKAEIHTDGEYNWKNLYPLYGFIVVAGKRCPIEALPEDENKFEVHAPAGFHFNGEGVLHTKLCIDREDLLTRVCGESFEACGDDC